MSIDVFNTVVKLIVADIADLPEDSVSVREKWRERRVALEEGRLQQFDPGTVAMLRVGAHGIMTLNDFKSMRGDAQMGVNSLPVLLGANGAARAASAIMALPQFVVIALLLYWHRPWQAGIVIGLLAAQLLMMRRFLGDPVARALWYSGFGVPLYVSGIMASAVALRSLGY